MGVMAFDHPPVGMAKLGRNDGERDTIHREATGVRVAEDVETYGGSDPRTLAGLHQRTLLVRFAPRLAVTPRQQQRLTGFPGGLPREEMRIPRRSARHCALCHPWTVKREVSLRPH
jgi:hypothetical protein